MENVSLEELRNALFNFSTPNTEVIQHAMLWTKDFLKIPNSLVYFVKLFQEDDSLQVLINPTKQK